MNMILESPTPQSTNYLGKILIKGPKEIMILEGTPTVLTCEVFLLAPPVLQSSEYDFFLGKPRVRWFQNEHELSFEVGDCCRHYVVLINSTLSERRRRGHFRGHRLHKPKGDKSAQNCHGYS